VLVFDDALPGFGMRKFKSGAASYFVKSSIGSQQPCKTLGSLVPIYLKAREGELRETNRIEVPYRHATLKTPGSRCMGMPST